MAIYNCKTIPISKMIPTGGGFVKPLCNTCKCKDCDNPIEKKPVSVLGIAREMRVYIMPYSVNMVIKCDGYVE